jgi:hypothetical protein
MSGELGEKAPPPGFTRSPTPSKLGEDWDRALAAFEVAETAVREIEAATAGYGFEAEEALLPEHDSACEAMEAALGRLLAVPAPDLAGLARKIELAFAHVIEPPAGGEDGLGTILGDARQLANAGIETVGRTVS